LEAFGAAPDDDEDDDDDDVEAAAPPSVAASAAVMWGRSHPAASVPTAKRRCSRVRAWSLLRFASAAATAALAAMKRSAATRSTSTAPLDTRGTSALAIASALTRAAEIPLLPFGCICW